MASMNLSEVEMKTIKEEFLDGRDGPPTDEEANIIEAVLASEKYTELVEDLMTEYSNALENGENSKITNAQGRVKKHTKYYHGCGTWA